TPTTLKLTDKFIPTYKSEDVFQRYARNCFIHRLLNKAFRLKNIDVLFIFRFFIRDLYEELKKLHTTSVDVDDKVATLRVYRDQQLRTDQLERIKSYPGGFISLNSFVSTSLFQALALNFAFCGDQTKSILFEIEADQRLSTKLFADMLFKSTVKHEVEVLFTPGFIFRISQIDYNPIIKLVLCSNDPDYQLKQV
ncbi:unnamed protein product, partial [Didymodactylos carnosus]